MRFSGIRLAFAEAGVVFVLALAVVSTARTLPETWTFLSTQHKTYTGLTRDRPNVVPPFEGLLPAPVRRFFLARIHAGDRYYVQVAEGPFMPGVDYASAVRTFARYELLPALEVDDPRAAEVILSVREDPVSLGLRYERVERAPDSGYSFARVQR